MSEKPKGSEIEQQKAVVNPEKLRHNQQRLNVGADHKTGAMKKGKRGTYP